MKIVAIGDSITEGYPYSLKDSWVHYLSERINLEIINQGVCGDSTQNMVERFKRHVISFRPTHVIILGGTNDASAGYSLNRVSSNYKEMVKMSQEHEITPILGLPIPSLDPDEESLLNQYRTWLRDFAKQEKLMCLDFFLPYLKQIEAGRASQYYAGEVHPSLEGYQFMGEIALLSIRMWRLVQEE